MKLMNVVKGFVGPATFAAASIGAVVVASNPRIVDTAKEVTLSAGTVANIYQHPIPTSATEPCRKGSANCIRTTWTPTEPTETEKSIQLIRDCLSKYPQDGKHGIDKGGTQIVQDLLDEGGSARMECRSGIGRFAKLVNDGKPFVDDLLVQVQPDGKIEVRSSSRKGYLDEGVNKKRVQQLASYMPESWDIPEPKYGN